jgi:hypothetical protein
MTKQERRIRDFSTGLKKLEKDSQDYIQNLTRVLSFVEQPPVSPVSGKDLRLEKKSLDRP